MLFWHNFRLPDRRVHKVFTNPFRLGTPWAVPSSSLRRRLSLAHTTSYQGVHIDTATLICPHSSSYPRLFLDSFYLVPEATGTSLSRACQHETSRVLSREDNSGSWTGRALFCSPTCFGVAVVVRPIVGRNAQRAQREVCCPGCSRVLAVERQELGACVHD